MGGPTLYEATVQSTTTSAYNGWNQFALQYTCDQGEQFSSEQEVNVASELPYGMNKQYLEVIRPSGIFRTWIGVNTASARTDVTHELSLKAIYTDGASLLELGEEQIQISEIDASYKQFSSSTEPKRKEVAFAFSKQAGSNYTVTQSSDSIRFLYKVISGGDNTKINIGPPEMLLDMPYSMGCYIAPQDFETNKPPVTVMSNLSPASCIINCLSESSQKRFAGLMNGNECLCSEEPPDTSMEYPRDEIEDEACNVTCSGNSEYVCGGANALNLYVA